MVDEKTIESIIWGVVLFTGVGTLGFLAYSIHELYTKPGRVFKEIKAKYSDSISLEKAKEYYSRLTNVFSFRGRDLKINMSDEQKSLFEKLEEKINPQIKKEILGAKITPRTKLEDISQTYKELFLYSRK